MLCAACGEPTDDSPCAACGAPALLADRYRLLRHLGPGEGAAGVFLARDLQRDVDVVVKERLYASSRDLKDWELFDREWEVLRQLDHPRVPAYVEHFQQGEGRRLALYLVVEYVPGQSLEQELDGKRASVEAAVRTVIELLGIVDDLHRLTPPIIHRDIKPANVIRDEQGRLHLVDFGSVRAALQPGPGITVVGTFGYMAPEQLAGDASCASDLYACGALLLRLLTRDDPSRLLGPGARDWREGLRVSRSLAEAIDALTAVDPADRPPSARAAIARLEQVDEITGVSTPAPAALVPASTATGPLTEPERGYIERVLRSAAKRGRPGIEAALEKILAEPSLPFDRRSLVHAEAERRGQDFLRAYAHLQRTIGGTFSMAAGLLVPLVTWLAFGDKAWGFFGWFAAFVPIGGLLLLWSAITRARGGHRQEDLQELLRSSRPEALGPGEE